MGETKVICYNCGAVILESDAFKVALLDAYYCQRCYLMLLEGKGVKVPHE